MLLLVVLEKKFLVNSNPEDGCNSFLNIKVEIVSTPLLQKRRGEKGNTRGGEGEGGEERRELSCLKAERLFVFDFCFTFGCLLFFLKEQRKEEEKKKKLLAEIRMSY